MEKASAKIKKILTASGWSQEALAVQLGVSYVTLNKWINERAVPREAAAEKIDLLLAEIVGSDVVDLAELSAMKARATAKHCSAKKILQNRELLERLTTTLTYHTNATEGSTMTEKDVRAVVYESKLLRNRTLVEQREAVNHQTALYFLLDELMDKGEYFTVSQDLIKSTHLRLMNGILANAGMYRNHGVRISGASVPLANFMKIAELMRTWCNEVNEETTDKIGLLARTHAEFERIHPFSDGNGRTGRLLLFIIALKMGLTPPIIRKDRRQAYYKYLELAQTQGATDALEKFIAEEILETAGMME